MIGDDGTTIFTLLRFNPRRAIRGAPAAEVRIQDDENEVVFWMSVKDIENNIREFGPHPGLLEAKQAYKDRKEIKRN